MRAPTPIAAAISRHTATAAGASCAGEHDAERLVLVGQLARARRVDVADLEQRDAGAAVRLVEGDRPQQPGPQRRAQHALLGDERVGDAQRVAVEPGPRQRVGREERVRHRLGDARARAAPRAAGGGAAGRTRQPAVQRRRRHAPCRCGRSRTCRATSSMTSISSALSGRHDGMATVADVARRRDTVKPIGSSSGGRSSAASDVPRMRLTSLTRTAARRARPAAATRPRASTAPAWTTRSGHVSREQLDEAGDRPCRCRTDRRRARSGPTPPSAGRGGPTVWLIRRGSNHAISSATVVVASLISVSSAAHDPGRGRSGGRRRRRSAGRRRSSVRSTPSSVVSVSPSRRRADAEPAAAERVEVVGVVRLAELEHHVVADVDDVVDRAHAGRRRAARPSTAPTGRRRRPRARST